MRYQIPSRLEFSFHKNFGAVWHEIRAMASMTNGDVILEETSMGFMCVYWDLDDDPHGNVQHIAEHDVSKEEVEEVFEYSEGLERG